MLRSSIIKEVDTCSICYEDMKSATCLFEFLRTDESGGVVMNGVKLITSILFCFFLYVVCKYCNMYMIEGSLEAKLPTIWTDEKQSREESERRDSSEEKRSEERRCRCAKR